MILTTLRWDSSLSPFPLLCLLGRMPNLLLPELLLNTSPSLEAVCHDHAQMMCVRSDQSDTLASGHAMMMSCPPPDHVRDHPDVKYPSHKAAFPNLPAAQLMRLYDTSLKLPSLGGEITPIQALQLIRAHPRYGELTEKDYDWLRGNLVGKSRCYGYVVDPIHPSMHSLKTHATTYLVV